ncbi:MAG: hypothetical protein Q9163_000186 [Psora crenata]
MDSIDTILSADTPRKKLKLEQDYINAPDMGLFISASHEKTTETTARMFADDDLRDKESAYGITEYVSPDSLGFSGILKKRYTDFLVNEILPSGEVVHLTNLKAPKNVKEKDNKTSSRSKPEVERSENPTATSTEIKNACEAISPGIKGDIGSQSCEALNGAAVQTPTSNSEPKDNLPLASNGSSDLLSHDPEALPPHKRIFLTKSVASNNTTESENIKPEETARSKQTVYLHHTSQGWVETDQPPADVEKEQKDEVRTGPVADEQEDGIVPTNETLAKDEAPEEPRSVAVTQEDALASWNAFAGADDRFQHPPEETEILESYFTPEFVGAIRSLYNRVLRPPHRPAREYGSLMSAVIDRQTRGKIHQEIRRIFHSMLESQTDNDGHVIISAMPKQPAFYGRSPTTQNDRSSNRNRDTTKKPATPGRPGWKDHGGQYLHFSLYKENKDTMESIAHLTRQLNIKPQAFQFAGTKDRRGVTVQRVSAHRVSVDRMIKAGRTLRNASVGNYEYHPSPLQLGDLTGNEFVITLRNCDFRYPKQADNQTILRGATSIVGEATRNLSEIGFINYYGLQRFGTFGVSTDAVGVAMLQGDFKRAVDAILYYTPACLETEPEKAATADSVSRDDHNRAEAIQLFQQSGEPYPALNGLPRKFSAEASIIRHLGKRGHENDYLGALQTISRNLRLMYVHAYQSLVWNMAASERWKKFGSTVIEGDLVLVDEHRGDDPAIKEEKIDADGEIVIQPTENDRAANRDDIFVRARTLSKEEAESGRYTVFDVVLPTPGFDILYPSNAIHEFYCKFMASERGGGLDPHDMRRSWKDISLSGSYRKLLAKPGKSISFEIKTYENENEQFVETDLDRYYIAHPEQDRRGQGRAFSKMPTAKEGPEENAAHPASDNAIAAIPGETDGQTSLPAATAPASASTSDMSSSMEIDNGGGGGVRLDWNDQPKDDKKIAVILKLQLGTSQYATMALRELMKHGGVKAFKMDYSGGR